MEYISSDTNVWIDFLIIDRLELPFRLPYTYLMDEDAISNELLEPVGLGKKLLNLGLQATELTEDEFYLADEYNTRFRKLSLYDSVALAIAKCRGITLLSGDGPLRKAAIQEGVTVIGTIGLLDKLCREGHIDESEYVCCLAELQRHNGGRIRLPSAELKRRIDQGKP